MSRGSERIKGSKKKSQLEVNTEARDVSGNRTQQSILRRERKKDTQRSPPPSEREK